MDGVHTQAIAAEGLAEQPALKQLDIVAMTGHGRPIDRARRMMRKQLLGRAGVGARVPPKITLSSCKPRQMPNTGF